MTNPLALVTGASGGIGLSIAEELARNKHDLVLVARNAKKLALIADTLEKTYGVVVQVLPADLGSREGVSQLIAELAARKLEPNVLVNNAGFGLFGKHADTDLADEQQMIDVNIIALTRLTKALLPAMLTRKHGRIMNVASTAAFQPGPYMAVYYATKAYVLSYSEAIAQELSGTGVTVTALCPGPTKSGFQDRADMHDSALVKGKKLPTAEEVAQYGVRAMFAGKRVAIHGAMNAILVQSLRVMPRRMITQVVAAMSKPSN
jgi:uncharacterized protein